MVKIKCLVHQMVGSTKLVPFESDMSKYGYILVGPAEFEFEMPADFNPVAAQITSLEKKLDAMSAEYQRNVAMIRNQISDLQCIEHSPAGAA